MKIGVISDTHNFLDPSVARLFKGVDHILHGGDIGLPGILQELEEIAPVTAVLGNTDDPGFGYRLTEVAELSGLKFLLHHIVNPRAPGEAMLERLARHRPDVVIFGHTHVPFSETINGVLYFNPGYAAKNRFGMQRSVAVLHCKGKEIRPEYFRL
jgi:putative phosphoesterase